VVEGVKKAASKMHDSSVAVDSSNARLIRRLAPDKHRRVTDHVITLKLYFD
jgi:hypothetical protein